MSTAKGLATERAGSAPDDALESLYAAVEYDRELRTDTKLVETKLSGELLYTKEPLCRTGVPTAVKQCAPCFLEGMDDVRGFVLLALHPGL